jgi:hypothetical protein
MMRQPETLHEVTGAIASRRFRLLNEAALQISIAAVLDAERIRYAREVTLDEAGRIDFLVGPPDARAGIGIEVKIDGSISSLVRQLQRYADHERVVALVVVVSRRRLANLPTMLCGKQIAVVDLVESCF